MKKVKSTIYVNEITTNANRVFGSTNLYYPAYLKLSDGSTVPLLFTGDQLEDARERAEKNQEDVGEYSPPDILARTVLTVKKWFKLHW